MSAFITSLLFVVLAEMGDKTQLLAMAFASRFRWQTVLWAVFFSTAVNHLMAVLLGSYLTGIIPLTYIKIIASGSFILFGLWTIRGDKLEDEDKRYNFSPFWTVFIAFFIAETGDKTQLATIALAVEYNSITLVWMGTTTGMVIADAIGIIIGTVLGKHIPEHFIKWFAALVFIAFGAYGLYEFTPRHFWTPTTIIGSLIILGLLIYGTLLMNKRREYKKSNDSPVV